MKHGKNVLALLLALTCLAPLAAQNKPRLAVLPFTGGSGDDGNAISLLLSNQKEIRSVFSVVPRNDNAIKAVFKEQNIQRSGLTDSDTISELGKQLNADFVVAGHIQKLGSKNLVLITIINVETLQQIAGDFKEYGKIEEVLVLLPDMTKKITAASKTTTAQVPKLAVLPFDIPEEVNAIDAEVLTQLLATEVANTGKYAVLPRTKTIETVMKEQNIQRSGLTDINSIKALGKATNADYVLAGYVLKLGTLNFFNAQILSVESGELLEGDAVEYQTMADGLKLMPQLSEKLTGVSGVQVVKAQRQVPVPAHMVLVEGGSFKRDNDTIKVSDFYMSKYEVTQKEWVAVMENNPSNFKGDTLPVESVSWYEVIEYCNRLSVKEGLDVVYSGSGDTTRMDITANGYRLPTEAEWEYAARGGKHQDGFEYSGSNNLDSVGWYWQNSGDKRLRGTDKDWDYGKISANKGKTHPVGTKYPNALGIYDLSGNVWEWCWDWYGAYSTGSQTNPTGSTSGSFRVYRGGSWYIFASDCRVSSRGLNSPGNRNGNLGFRPVRSLR